MKQNDLSLAMRLVVKQWEDRGELEKEILAEAPRFPQNAAGEKMAGLNDAKYKVKMYMGCVLKRAPCQCEGMVVGCTSVKLV